MRRLIFLALLVPGLVFAQVHAGFPAESIWASKTRAIEGETIVLSAVVFNSGAEQLRGTLVFTADGARIGAREFDIAAGGSQIHSVEWKPTTGEYQVAAAIEGTSAELSRKETASIGISVEEPPPPPVVVQTISQAVETAGVVASSTLPLVRGAATAIFETIEPYRQQGVEHLETYLEQARDGTVAGTSTSNVGGFSNSQKKEKGVVNNIAQAAAASALFVMSSLYLFYPLLALLVLATLYTLAKRIRRRPEE